jgi:tRNA-Thr(GGU) m(6)t(6)A37 methyltransferase TsaA
MSKPSSCGDEGAFGIREGELAVELPPPADAALRFIGRIRTPWTRREDCPKNSSEAREPCTVEVFAPFVPALAGLESCSHAWLVYWMDRAPRNLIVQKPRHYEQGRGTFALRSPARPNPIALAAVKLLGIDGARLTVVGVDCLDGTPLLDIKPYFASTDSIPDASVGWHAEEKARRDCHSGAAEGRARNP